MNINKQRWESCIACIERKMERNLDHMSLGEVMKYARHKMIGGYDWVNPIRMVVSGNVGFRFNVSNVCYDCPYKLEHMLLNQEEFKKDE